MKSIEEIIKELTPIEKVQTLISMIDTPMGRRKYPKGIILLAQSLKEDYPTNPQTRINIQTILNKYSLRNTYNINHQSYKAFRISFYLRSLLV